MELHFAVADNSQIDIDLLVAAASRVAGFDVAPSDVALVLISAQLDEIRARHAERVQWTIWDKETPINGIAPDVVMSRGDYNGGEIYLIYIDGQLVFLQPHHPEANAPVHADEAHEVAAIHSTSIVSEYVFDEIVSLVVSQATPPTPVVSMDDLREVMQERQTGFQGNSRRRGAQ